MIKYFFFLYCSTRHMKSCRRTKSVCPVLQFIFLCAVLQLKKWCAVLQFAAANFKMASGLAYSLSYPQFRRLYIINVGEIRRLIIQGRVCVEWYLSQYILILVRYLSQYLYIIVRYIYKYLNIYIVVHNTKNQNQPKARVLYYKLKSCVLYYKLSEDRNVCPVLHLSTRSIVTLLHSIIKSRLNRH